LGIDSAAVCRHAATAPEKLEDVTAPQVRNLCSPQNPIAQGSVQERPIPDVALTELVIFCGRIFYKDVAPLALGKAAVNAPQSRRSAKFEGGGQTYQRLECVWL
jgi:hypothetical protein